MIDKNKKNDYWYDSRDTIIGAQEGALVIGERFQRRIKKSQMLNEIPPVPEVSKNDIIPYLNDSIVDEMLVYKKFTERDSVLILTPIHNVAKVLKKVRNIHLSINTYLLPLTPVEPPPWRSG